MNSRWRRLRTLGLCFLCGCALPEASSPAEQDLPTVFRKTVHLGEGISGMGPDWKEGKLDKGALPRYPCRKPVVGDFALYSVHGTYDARFVDSQSPRRQTAAYLILEFITTAREDHHTKCHVRVYGASHERWGRLIHKGITNVYGVSGRARHPEGSWPGGYLGSYDGNSLSVEDLSYFRDYAEFAADKDVNVRQVAFHQFPPAFAWGRMHVFGVKYSVPQGVWAGDEYLILSDRVPVRGLLYGYSDWSSSSGLHNHTEHITLHNQGRLTPAQIGILESAQDVFPSEEALWRTLVWNSARPND